MYQIKPIENQKEWEDFLLTQPYTLFVQAPAYGKFYEAMGERSFILGIYEKDILIGGSLIVSVHARRGNFLYLPYGPILDFNNEKALNYLVDYLKKFAKDNNFDFIRFSPFAHQTEDRKKIFKKIGFLPAPMHILAETTWILDLNQTEEAILGEMKKNHRNLIRRCQKEGVTIKIKTDQESLIKFNDLHDETAKKHHFHRFSREYISHEFNSFAPNGQAVIFESYLPDGRHDASAIIMYYGNTAAYRHAASLNLDSKIPTSYLIQWEAIKEARKRGMKWYNFWGIAPESSPKSHPFKGITHFKTGFGGNEKSLIHCQDLPITKKYWLNWLVETMRRIKRRF
jgi:lipid II:glycine glycyltransferase (peptidoglycan interpeptide bridge formation enzyme)